VAFTINLEKTDGSHTALLLYECGVLEIFFQNCNVSSLGGKGVSSECPPRALAAAYHKIYPGVKQINCCDTDVACGHHIILNVEKEL